MEEAAPEGGLGDQRQRHLGVVGQPAGFGAVLRNTRTGLPVLFAAVAKLVELDLLRLGLPLAIPGL